MSNNAETWNEINVLVPRLIPGFKKLGDLLKKMDVHEFEIRHDTDVVIRWTDRDSPLKTQLTQDITNILDRYYPADDELYLLDMVYNPNRQIAESIATSVEQFCKRTTGEAVEFIKELLP